MKFWNEINLKIALSAFGLTLLTILSTSTEDAGIMAPMVSENSPVAAEGADMPTDRSADDRAARSTDERGADQPAMPAEKGAEPKQPAKPGEAKADKPKQPANLAVPSRNQLMPSAPQGAQSRFSPSVDQLANARTIAKVAEDKGLPPRAAVIAVATSLQESKLTNLGHLGNQNDHDSQGLFQQRPSAGWGTVKEITDPVYAANAFYNSMKKVNGWQHKPLTDVAQAVQVSAFPFAYAQWEEFAVDLVLASYGSGRYA